MPPTLAAARYTCVGFSSAKNVSTARWSVRSNSAWVRVTIFQENIYHESRGEPLSARKAVAEVTLRRSNTKGYPKDVCGVVSQYKQFSWVKKKHPVNDKRAWRLARIAAVEVYRGFTNPVTKHAIYFNHVSYGKRYPTPTKPIIIGRLEFY